MNTMTDTQTTQTTPDETTIDRHPLVLQNIENSCRYNTRILEIINNSEEYLKDFYDESPNFTFSKDYINKLIWLTYSDKDKKQILDRELEEYFN
jgi:hypothetical protein